MVITSSKMVMTKVPIRYITQSGVVAGAWTGVGGIGGVSCGWTGIVVAGGVAVKGIGSITDGDAAVGVVVVGDGSVVNAPTGLQALRLCELTALTFQ